MPKNFKVPLGLLVVVGAITYLIFSSLANTMVAYYTTVEEALAGEIDPTKNYRIEGKINVEEATFDGTKNPVELKFQIYNETAPDKKLTVIYHDVKPDNFMDATGAIVEGRFNPDGTIQADTLNLQCPSKYEDGETGDKGRISKFLRSLGLKK